MTLRTPKLDLHFRHIDNALWYRFWWRFMPGVTVTVQWPRGWTQPNYLGKQNLSADPDDHYRPYMEQHIGRQGWDWDWRIDNIANDTLTIKLRRQHQHYAAVLAMKWA